MSEKNILQATLDSSVLKLKAENKRLREALEAQQDVITRRCDGEISVQEMAFELRDITKQALKKVGDENS